jgi:maleate cis-trans isomerase
MARSRIGLLIASANTTIEHEFQTLSRPGMSIHSTRLPHRKLSDETVAQMRHDAVAAAALLEHVSPYSRAKTAKRATDHNSDLVT